MSLADSLIVSLIGIAVVFSVLILLSFFIKLQSVIVEYVMEYNIKAATRKNDTENIPAQAETAATGEGPAEAGGGWTAGELKLVGVDEKTAAMIMAIVSHESQIPLSELQFKIIKAID